MAVENANPVVYQAAKQRPVTVKEEQEDVYDEIDSREVFGKLFVYFFRATTPRGVHLF